MGNLLVLGTATGLECCWLDVSRRDVDGRAAVRSPKERDQGDDLHDGDDDDDHPYQHSRASLRGSGN